MEKGRVDALNLTSRVLGSSEPRGSSVVWIWTPLARTSEGSDERKSRAARDRIENGLNRVLTSVMNRVIMVAAVVVVVVVGLEEGEERPRTKCPVRYLSTDAS